MTRSLLTPWMKPVWIWSLLPKLVASCREDERDRAKSLKGDPTKTPTTNLVSPNQVKLCTDSCWYEISLNYTVFSMITIRNILCKPSLTDYWCSKAQNWLILMEKKCWQWAGKSVGGGQSRQSWSIQPIYFQLLHPKTLSVIKLKIISWSSKCRAATGVSNIIDSQFNLTISSTFDPFDDMIWKIMSYWDR